VYNIKIIELLKKNHERKHNFKQNCRPPWHEQGELATMKLMDGVTVLEADAFEAGMEVFIVTEDEQRVALPVGEYELEDGSDVGGSSGGYHCRN
jgi:phosphoglycolate phosphatase-like HAD superfamily hydrolase